MSLEIEEPLPENLSKAGNSLPEVANKSKLEEMLTKSLYDSMIEKAKPRSI